jgi:hypothetical protein
MTIHEFLSRTMGFGFKTALEVAMIAAEAGAVPIDKEGIAIAGTGWLGGGADCAIIAIPRIKFNEIKKRKKQFNLRTQSPL